MKLIANARRDALKLWSIRWSLAAALVTGLIGVWDAFNDVLPWWLFVPLGVALHLATPVFRLLHQGDEDEPD